MYVEKQNSFRPRGQSATLTGRPDLIVVNGDYARIIDVKNGREQPGHTVQIKIYQHDIPRALPQGRLARLAGEVVYPSHNVGVPHGGLPAPTTQPPASIKGNRG